MDSGLAVSIIGVIVTIAGIFAGYLFTPSVEKRKELRTVTRVPLTKLMNEILLMESGVYPGITIRSDEFNELISLLTERKAATLKKLVQQYESAHNNTAKIQHYHATRPSGSVFFLNAFDIINPEETIEQLKPLLRFLQKI